MNAKKHQQAARVRRHQQHPRTWEMWCAYRRPWLVRRYGLDADPVGHPAEHPVGHGFEPSASGEQEGSGDGE